MVPNIIAVTVRRDGDGHSAFGFDEHFKPHRLSPSWVRDVLEDKLRTFDVPTKRVGEKAKVTRMSPVKVGTRLVTGESLFTATQRALTALKLIAKGLPVEVPPEKKP